MLTEPRNLLIPLLLVGLLAALTLHFYLMAYGSAGLPCLNGMKENCLNQTGQIPLFSLRLGSMQNFLRMIPGQIFVILILAYLLSLNPDNNLFSGKLNAKENFSAARVRDYYKNIRQTIGRPDNFLFVWLELLKQRDGNFKKPSGA